MTFKSSRPPERSGGKPPDNGDEAHFQQSLARLAAELARRRCAAALRSAAALASKSILAFSAASAAAVRSTAAMASPSAFSWAALRSSSAPRAAALAPRKRRLFRSALLATGIGTGAIAVGLLLGFLVNGPPQRPMVPRVVADISSAARPADRMKTATAAVPAPAAPLPAAIAPAAPAAAPTAPVVPPPAAAAPATPDPTAAAAQMPAAEVREVQGRLRAMGFNPGPVDGQVGPLTENAAKLYQRARGLEVTGTVDRTLLARLRQETPPPRRYSGNSPAGNTAAAQRRPRNDFNDFLDNLDRLFRR